MKESKIDCLQLSEIPSEVNKFNPIQVGLVLVDERYVCHSRFKITDIDFGIVTLENDLGHIYRTYIVYLFDKYRLSLSEDK